MEMIKVNSLDEFLSKLKGSKRSFLLIYKKGAEKSDCAYKQILEALKTVSDIKVFTADVNEVKDIHAKYEITTAPSLLQFDNEQFVNTVKGCNSIDHYKGIFEDAVYHSQPKDDSKPQKSVTVYTSPTCSWCTTLKRHLKQHRVYFNEIDISKDQNAAEDLVRKSGQRGVPQTEIDGQIVVGFDKAKLNQLLDIK